MVTNYGLEAQKTVNPLLSGSIYAFGFNQVAVGTGSNAPAATDTSLQTEVARLNTVHGTDTTVMERVANSYVQIKTTLARKATFSASYTLREFGFFSTSATNTCMYRQLFRQNPNDLNSTPITIQVYAYDTLIITYTVIWRIDVSNTLNVGYTTGTLSHPSGNVSYTLYPVVEQQTSEAISAVLQAFHPYPTWANATLGAVFLNSTSYVMNIGQADRTLQYSAGFTSASSPPGFGQTAASSVQKTPAATGTYKTTLKATFGASFGSNNNAVYALLVGNYVNIEVAYDGPSGYDLLIDFANGVAALIGHQNKIKTTTQTWTLEWDLSWAAI